MACDIKKYGYDNSTIRVLINDLIKKNDMEIFNNFKI